MNHDETNSKPDPKPEVQAWIEPGLEARVVAWVAGEASPFEIAELERLVAEKPELGIFKRRIEAVQGLVAEAVRPDKEPLRMSEERRAKLLGTIGVAAAADATALGGRLVALPESQKRSWWTPRAARLYYALGGLAAACLLVFLQLPRYKKPADREAAMIRSEKTLGSEAEITPLEEQLAQRRMPKPKESDASAPAVAAFTVAPSSGFLPASAPQITPPAEVRFDATPAQRKVTLSEFAAGSETKNVVVSGLVGGAAGGGRMESGGPGYRYFAERPQPSATVPEPAAGATTGFSEEGRRIGGGGLPATAPAEPIVRLDAFTVSGQREGNAAAIASSANAPAPFGNKLESISPSAFADGIKASVEKSRALGDARDSTLGTIALNSGTLGADLSASRISASGSIVTSEDKKKWDFTFGGATFGAITTDLGGVKEAAKAAPADLPLQRPASAAATTDDSLRAEVATATQAESTFSLHVSDVSFRLAQAALMRGEEPDPARIRPEEFYNAFDYGDAAPANAEKIGARIEQSAHPFLQQRNLVRIAMKVPATGRGASQPLRLTVLLDTSGSMEREDRAASVRRAVQELIALLGPNDRITLIGFARQPRLLAESVPGNQAGRLVDLLARTPAEGGTNLEEALKLGGELARRHALSGAQNRIVVLTDGAANLGDADPEHLARAIETFRQQGIAFDACGVGLDGLDDAVLEALTRKGDGRYYVLNSPNEADAGFARQLAGSLRPAAENVKLQVRFNPARVGRYRLIGFEQHRLRTEDFRNDQVDAAELAAEEAAVALYQVEVLPQGAGELGEVFVRFRDAATGAMVERSWAIPHEPQAPRFERASPSMQLAGTAALFAEKLAESPVGKQFKLGDLAGVVTQLRGHYGQEPRVQELVRMFEQARRLRRE